MIIQNKELINWWMRRTEYNYEIVLGLLIAIGIGMILGRVIL